VTACSSASRPSGMRRAAAARTLPLGQPANCVRSPRSAVRAQRLTSTRAGCCVTRFSPAPLCGARRALRDSGAEHRPAAPGAAFEGDGVSDDSSSMRAPAHRQCLIGAVQARHMLWLVAAMAASWCGLAARARVVRLAGGIAQFPELRAQRSPALASDLRQEPVRVLPPPRGAGVVLGKAPIRTALPAEARSRGRREGGQAIPDM